MVFCLENYNTTEYTVLLKILRSVKYMQTNINKHASCLTINKLCVRYKTQSVKAASGTDRCLLYEPRGTQIHCVDTSRLEAAYTVNYCLVSSRGERQYLRAILTQS
jgi:hypothetical protein